MAALNGKWQLVSSENFGKYIQAIGVSDDNIAKAKDMLEKMGAGGLVEEYVIVPGKSIKRSISLGGQVLKESPTVPFNTELSGPSLDGRTAKIMLTENGPNKLTRVEKFDNGIEATTVYEAKGDELFTTLSAAGVVSKRNYKKI